MCPVWARGATDAEAPPEWVLSLDHVFEALAHPRRRYLCHLLFRDGEWSLTDLARKTAAWENGIDEAAVTDSQRDRVYASLYHAHVPKLVRADVVTFDDATDGVVTAENAEQVLIALAGIGERLDAARDTHLREESRNGES